MKTRTLFWLALAATLLLKLYLAQWLPMSGDEAYFVMWAQHPALGFYDHPPMVGWILQLLLHAGHSPLVLRLPAVLLSTLIGLGIYLALRRDDQDRAALAAVLYLISPVNLLNVLITTDTPLILFAFLSGLSLFLALSRHGWWRYALAGAFLGMAFLSKYFAVLLGLAYLAYFLFSPKSGRKTGGFALLLATALPLAAINLYWNYTHCWDNVLFNLYTRNEGETLSLGNVLIFLGSQVYLMTPPVIYYLFRRRSEWLGKWRRDEFKLFAYAFLVPMAAFAALSLKKVIGLHWVLAFYPFLYLLAYVFLTQRELLKSVKFMAYFSLAHLLIVAAVAALPMETWRHSRLYGGIVFMFDTDRIVQRLRPYEKDYLFATDGYTPSAIISYHYGKYFFVFGKGSYHARQDDLITDFSRFDGRDILVLGKSPPNPVQYAPYFRTMEIKSFTLRGATFYLVLGRDFNYPVYRERVLRPIREKYYRIPSYLPHGPCYFCTKYFPHDPC